MASGATIDIEALLAPIPGDKSSGESLRYAGPYDAIQEARRADDPNLPQGDWKREVKIADWRQVIALACEALAAKSKDIQIAAWLTEALSRRNGFAGARDGFRLIRGLHERFWETLFPEIQEGDLEYRASALEWLNDKLPIALFEIPLTRPLETGEAYSLLRWQESRAVEPLGRKNPDALPAAVAEGKITGEAWDKAVALGARAFYEELFGDLSEASQECAKLAAIADEKFGAGAPSLNGIAKALDECRQIVEGILAKKREAEPDSSPAGANNAEPGPAEPGNAAVAAGNGAAAAASYARGAVPLDPVDRVDALRRLEAIAAFFHRSEPHSPVSYLVQRAVRWGQMPLEQWLTDVISDEAVLTRIRETLGIRNSGEGGG